MQVTIDKSNPELVTFPFRNAEDIDRLSENSDRYF